MRRLVTAAALLLAGAPAFGRDRPDRETILYARDEVFARPEFRQRTHEGESVVTLVLRKVAEHVWRFREDHPTAFLVVMGMLALTLVVLVAHIVWTIVVSRRARYLPEPDLPELDVRRTPPEEFRDRAVRLARIVIGGQHLYPRHRPA